MLQPSLIYEDELPRFGFVAARAVELRADAFPKGGRGQVVLLPASVPKDAHEQAFSPQEDAGLFTLLWKERGEKKKKEAQVRDEKPL